MCHGPAIPHRPKYPTSSEPITTRPHGSRKPTAANAEPATDNQRTKSSSRARASGSVAFVRDPLEPAPDPSSVAWPAHSRAGAGGPAGTATAGRGGT